MDLHERAAVRLGAYVPRLLGSVLGETGSLPEASRTLHGRGVALIADLSGFTALSERLCARGPDGIEELTLLLNATFGRMVDTIAAHGGDTLRFAGDAPIAVWWGAADADPSRSVAAAAACGRRLQEEMPADGTLSMRVGIGSGSLVATTVGGVDGRWELIVSGTALRAMAAAERRCPAGEIALSPEAERCAGDVAGLAADGPPVRVLPAAVQRAFIPRSVLVKLDAGQAEWLAEMRRVSVLFGNLRGFDPAGAEAPALMHEAFRRLQTSIYRHGGGINQFLVDDKGVTLVAAWGLPGTTHEDDARRAVRAALEAAEGIREMGLELDAGAASGEVYSGSRGNDTRREYAMIGDTVNLAARLMVASEGRVLCDAATSRRSGLAPAERHALQLKGKAATVSAFAYASAPEAPATQPGVEIIGREPERRRIDRVLAGHRRGDGGVLWIEGEAGIGKSVLVAEAARRAREEGGAVFVRAGDAVGRNEAYLCWRGLLEEIFGVQSPEALPAALRSSFAGQADLLDRIPLLAPLTGRELEETELTRQLGGDVRTDATRDLVVRLLEGTAGERPLVLVFDDGHWIDSASWALLRALTRRLPRVLVVIGARPLEADGPADAAAVRAGAGEHVALEGLNDPELTLLAAHRVGARALSPDVARLIAEKAGGHPLFAGELIASLADTGRVQVTDGLCAARPGAGDLDGHAFPDTVQGIIRMRIDRLDPGEQLTLKLASVIGATFEYRTLRDTHSLLDGESALRGQLGTLAERNLTAVETPEPELAYRFRHALIRDVAYGLMLPEQRREVHARVAGWLEQRFREAPPWALLAHHWTRTRHHARSLECLEAAGAEANRTGAPREADRFYAEASELVASTPDLQVPPGRAASWDSGRTEASFAVGDFAAGRRHAERGLRRLHRPLPRRNAGWYPRLALEVLMQAAGRLRRSRPDRRDPSLRVELFGQLSLVAFYQRDVLPMIVAGLAAINAAERHGAPQSAAKAYAMLGTVAAGLGLSTTADAWWGRAEASPDSRWRTAAISGRAFDALNRGRWEAADGFLEEAGALARKTGDRMGLESVLMLEAYRHSYASTPRQAEATGRALLEAARLRESLQRELWGHLVIAGNRMERGDAAGAIEQLLSGRAAVAAGDPASVQAYHALLGESYWRCRDAASALQHVEQARRSILDHPDLGMGNHYADGPIVVVSLGLAQRGGGERRAHLKRARWSLRRLHRAGRVAVYTRARARRLEGSYWQTRGKPRTALRWWRAALTEAQAARLPLERALAHEALGSVPNAGRAEHRARADELFENLELNRGTA